MEDKTKIEGTYFIHGEEKPFSIEVDIPEIKDEKVKRLIGLMDKPYLLLVQGAGTGLVAARKVLFLLFLFFLCNFFLSIYGIYRFFVNDAIISHLPWVLGVVLVGFIGTALAAYKGYQYALLGAIQLCYNAMNGVFHQLSTFIVKKAAEIMKTGSNAEDKNLAHALNIADMVNQRFKKLPRLLRKGIIMVLKRVPILGMLTDLRGDIVQGNTEVASKKLFTKIDEFIQDMIFSKNTTRWLWIVFFANMLVSIFIIQYKIG